MSSKFGLDYAKRIAKCKKCQQQLFKGDLRMWRMVPNPYTVDTGNPTEMKNYFHPDCLFETLTRCRATTKVIDSPDDIEDEDLIGWDAANDDDKEMIREKISSLLELRQKKFGDKVTTSVASPSKDTSKIAVSKNVPPKDVKDEKREATTRKKKIIAEKVPKQISSSKTAEGKTNIPSVKNEQPAAKILKLNEADQKSSKFDVFKLFCKLCDVIASVSKYTEKTKAVKIFINKEGYDGDLYLLLKFLIPETDERVYNLKAKQIIKIFSALFDWSVDELTESFNQTGDVSETICSFFSKFDSDQKKSKITNQMVDEWLGELSGLTREMDQQSHFSEICELVSCLELKYIIRLIMKDLRINAGAKHVLEGLREGAYEIFQHSRNLQAIVEKCQCVGEGKLLERDIVLNTPVKPMLATPCRTVEQAMKQCTREMYAEIKYDGERLQLHKDGTNFTFFSRSLKPTLDHKVADLNKVVSEAFPTNIDLIVDAEMLLIDTNTGKPLPFGTLGIHKKKQFKDAAVCLFVFDCMYYDSKSLIDKSLRERRKFLEVNMKEIPNRVLLSNCHLIKKGENNKLQMLISKTIDEGLEGLVLKDLDSIYEPGKRHWLKIKKDYLKESDMADTADLILLGAFYGTGNKGGTLSVFLMGAYDKKRQKFCTVTKCGSGFDDATLDRINKELEPKNLMFFAKMRKISRVHGNLPGWIECSRSLVPDFIVIDPKASPVWEITGAEFTRSNSHKASGISIRFPRMTRIRDDKNWETATSLQELETLMELSKTKSDFEPGTDEAISPNPNVKSKGSAEDDEGEVLTARKRKREEINGSRGNGEKFAVSDKKEDEVDEETEAKKVKIPCKLVFVRNYE